MYPFGNGSYHFFVLLDELVPTFCVNSQLIVDLPCSLTEGRGGPFGVEEVKTLLFRRGLERKWGTKRIRRDDGAATCQFCRPPFPADSPDEM